MSEDDESIDESVGNKVSKGMREVFVAEFERLRKPTDVPERLYHFSDGAGLSGIVHGRALWASLATCLNDASEVAFGLSRVHEVIDAKLAKKDSAFLRHTKAFLKAAIVEPYVTCFCGSVDRALHWLHYGRSGSGMALGFEGSRLVPNDHFILIRVIYDVAVFDAKLHSVLAGFEQRIAEHAPGLPHRAWVVDMEEFAAKLAAVLLAAQVASVKNPAFAAEEEWRLVCTEMDGHWMPHREVGDQSPDKLFRMSGQRVVPYRKVEYKDADSFPLREIVLGHSSVVRPDDPGLAVLLRQCFKKTELMPTVRLTDTPVR